MPQGENGMLRTTVDVDGESREIEVGLPEGHVLLSSEELSEKYVPKTLLESKIKTALKGRKRFEEIVEDEDLLEQIAATKEDWLRDRLKIEGEKPDVSRLQETWRQQEVKPLEQQVETMQGEVKKLRQARLSADVNEAAVELGVKKSQLELLTPYYQSRVAWSDEYGDWFIVGKDGEFEYSANPHEGAPYLTIREDLDRKARSGEKEDWFDGKGRTGPDYQGGKGGGRPGQVDLATFEKMSGDERAELFHEDRAKYDQLMAELTEKNRAKRAS